MKYVFIATALAFSASAFAAESYICDGTKLGYTTPAILTVDGDSLHFVNGGVDVTGTKVSGVKGFTTFSNFRPAKAFPNGQLVELSDDLLKSGKGKVITQDPAVNPHWEDDCRKLAAGDAAKLGCEGQFEDQGYLTNGATAKKVSDKLYQYSQPNKRTDEPLVWNVPVHMQGQICVIDMNKSVAQSCPAVVFDAVAKKAGDDGSSSGSPWVSENKDGSYNSGIHDVESGEFSYKIEVTKKGSSCEIKSISKNLAQ